MDDFRQQFRNFFNDETLFAKGRDDKDANNKVVIISQPIKAQAIWYIKAFALGSILLAYLFFGFLFNEWVVLNEWVASAFAIVLCVCALSVSLSVYIERRIGYWALSRGEAFAMGHDTQRREWRFVVR